MVQTLRIIGKEIKNTVAPVFFVSQAMRLVIESKETKRNNNFSRNWIVSPD